MAGWAYLRSRSPGEQARCGTALRLRSALKPRVPPGGWPARPAGSAGDGSGRAGPRGTERGGRLERGPREVDDVLQVGRSRVVDLQEEGQRKGCNACRRGDLAEGGGRDVLHVVFWGMLLNDREKKNDALPRVGPRSKLERLSFGSKLPLGKNNTHTRTVTRE